MIIFICYYDTFMVKIELPTYKGVINSDNIISLI